MSTEQHQPKEPSPLWLRMSTAPKGELPSVRSTRPAYSLGLFSGWDTSPAVNDLLPTQAEHVFHGPTDADWLVVSYMSCVVPGHDMHSWLGAPLAMCGFPSFEVATRLAQSPRLLLWNEEAPGTYGERLAMDETLAHSGLALFGDSAARVFALMMRRGTIAWKFVLSISSQAGSGEELLRLRDDCIRARSIFESIHFGGE